MKVYVDFPKSCIISFLYRFLQFSLTLISPNILLKSFLSKTASHLAIPLFNVQDSAPYVATGATATTTTTTTTITTTTTTSTTTTTTTTTTTNNNNNNNELY